MAERDERLEDEVEDLREDLEEMDRPDRAIPLPKGDDEDDGVGPVTGVVP
ncbi:MAG: hypothetical protein ACT6TH_04775 [Brevundimonas sp.]|jgi:hypothetical protein